MMICKTNLNTYKCSLNNISKESLIDINMYDLHLKNVFIKDEIKNLTCTYTLSQEKEFLELKISLFLDDRNIDNINFQSTDEQKDYAETARQYIQYGQYGQREFDGYLIKYARINKRQILFELITDEKYSKIIQKEDKFQRDKEIKNFVVIQYDSQYKYIFNGSELGCFVFQK